jgi:hypothetical protein
MFAQPLTLKGPVPPIVFGQIKTRTRVAKAVNGELAVKAASAPAPVEPALLRETWKCAYFRPATHEEYNGYEYLPNHYRDDDLVEDVVVPRLMRCLGDRPTSDVDRQFSYCRYMRTCYRSWKARRFGKSKSIKRDSYRSA